MENRDQVIDEYFQLRVLLNRANAKKNESTELDFEIVQKEKNLYLYAKIQSIKFDHKIELCFQKVGRSWQPSYCTKFLNFEEFCADFLNNGFQTQSLTLQAESLKVSLRSLGIPAK